MSSPLAFASHRYIAVIYRSEPGERWQWVQEYRSPRSIGRSDATEAKRLSRARHAPVGRRFGVRDQEGGRRLNPRVLEHIAGAGLPGPGTAGEAGPRDPARRAPRRTAAIGVRSHRQGRRGPAGMAALRARTEPAVSRRGS